MRWLKERRRSRRLASVVLWSLPSPKRSIKGLNEPKQWKEEGKDMMGNESTKHIPTYLQIQTPPPPPDTHPPTPPTIIRKNSSINIAFVG